MYSWVSVCVLVVSIVSLIMSTHRGLRSMLLSLSRDMAEGNQSTYLAMYRHSTPVTAIIFIENVTILFFVVELTIKVACCCCCYGESGGQKQRWRRLCKFFTLLDVCSIVPNVVLFILSLVYFPELYTQDEITESSEITRFLYIIETLRFVRVFRLLRLVEQVPAMKLLYVALKSSYRELLILIALLTFLVVIWGAVIFYAELATDTFHGIGYGMWWALVTMTTVGYGDYFPKSGAGYFVGTLCAVTGILILALPIPVITNNFNTYYRLYQFLGRIRARDTCKEAQREGVRKGACEGRVEAGDADDLKDSCEAGVARTRVQCSTTNGSVA
jgi:voltage-gated potassium channel Kch